MICLVPREETHQLAAPVLMAEQDMAILGNIVQANRRHQ
jgi:hypothetical protein